MNALHGSQEDWRSDDQLMEAVVNGESDALEIIYLRYESLLRTIIVNVVHDETEADDILHDVLLQIWSQAHRYNPNQRGLRGLLVTLARRRSFDRLRRRAAYRRATDNLQTDFDNPLAGSEPAFVDQAQTSDLSELLRRFIEELPEAQKEVIVLTFFLGMSQREIAAQRHISLGTVKTRLQLAQQKLYRHLLPLQNKI